MTQNWPKINPEINTKIRPKSIQNDPKLPKFNSKTNIKISPKSAQNDPNHLKLKPKLIQKLTPKSPKINTELTEKYQLKNHPK